MQRATIMVESLVLAGVLGWWVWGRGKRQWKQWREARGAKPKRKRELRPRTPKDCRDWRVEAQLELPAVTRTTQAWSEVKSQCGRPKEYDSDGQACMNPACKYYKDTDGLHHALRRDGSRNECEATPQWECGAWLSKHTARLGPPLYGLKTSSERVKLATHLAMKGNSIADISEVLGHSETTIARWLDRGGVHSDRLHERDFKGLRCGHIQLDELVGKVRRWGRRVWVWVAQDVTSKAWLAWWVGRRKQADAHRLIHRVKAGQAADHVPAYSSDGLNQYFYALTAHYGEWVEEGAAQAGMARAAGVAIRATAQAEAGLPPATRVHDDAVWGPSGDGRDATSVGAEWSNPNGVCGALESHDQTSGGRAATSDVGVGVHGAQSAVPGRIGRRVLQLLPDAPIAASGDGDRALPRTHPRDGVGGDGPLLECAGVSVLAQEK
jgi:transposase-like protein